MESSKELLKDFRERSRLWPYLLALILLPALFLLYDGACGGQISLLLDFAVPGICYDSLTGDLWANAVYIGPLMFAILFVCTFHAAYGVITVSRGELAMRLGWKRKTLNLSDVQSMYRVPAYRIEGRFVSLQNPAGEWMRAELWPSTLVQVLVSGPCVVLEAKEGRRIAVRTRRVDPLMEALKKSSDAGLVETLASKPATEVTKK